MYLIGTTCFDKGFLFHVITGRQSFFTKVYGYHDVLFNSHVLGFYENSDLKEFRISAFFISVMADNANNKMKTSEVDFQNKALVYHICQIF